MSEAQEWHFISVVDQQQYGPYSAEQLQQFAADGTVTRETFLWTESLEEWIPASNVEGLFQEQALHPHRPTLLTGAAAQAARPLGGAPAPQSYQPPVQQPYQQSYQQPGQAGAVPVAAPVSGIGLGPPSVPPGENYPAPGLLQASFGWLFTLGGLALVCFIGSGVVAAARLAAAARSGSATVDDLAGALGEVLLIVMSGMFLGILCLLIYRILAFIYLYRAWKALQWGNVRTSPGKAVGFLFIPFFSLYWIFVAYFGLAKDWNRVVASHPNLAYAPRLSPGLSLTYCILAVCVLPFWLFASATASSDGSNPFALLLMGLMVATVVFELIVYGSICRGIKFMGSLHLTQLHHQAPGGGIRLY